jgi:hypothetical protein
MKVVSLPMSGKSRKSTPKELCMNIRTAAVRPRIEGTDKPLMRLLQRARQSKRNIGGDEPAESEAARAAYAQLGKLVGR